jgi:hypothetical protein
MTNLIMFCRHSNNTTIFSVSNTPLHWAQLRVSTLCIGHHQVVLRLVEQLYNKLGILGGVGGGGTRCPIHRAETCSCTHCNCILLIEYSCVMTVCIIHNKICY